MIDAAETPKNTKKGTRLFRSKLLSASQNVNKKYQKRQTVIRATPTSCVSCFDEQDTGSDNDLSHDSPIQETPKKRPMRDEDFRMHYLTSTPGIPETPIVEDCATPTLWIFEEPPCRLLRNLLRSCRKLCRFVSHATNLQPVTLGISNVICFISGGRSSSFVWSSICINVLGNSCLFFHPFLLHMNLTFASTNVSVLDRLYV